MLKRLQLIGFKSFADRVDFDFPPGITAIVGPNGSGKSNIVDAVRWVLGEQSAKSLRGGEMSDVIFNGSASRRSLGHAEVTLTFDNARRRLASDAEEIQISRRVYRSGEGEYLINQQLCRLKDVKDLFLGSGAGADAYSIIEQGRVDVLLQASTKERRTIFEEAAGISRFKAKKTETLRKLERVDLNLQRLKDILDEVDKQLRSVRLQASKAQRYQEYSGRLRELRIGLGLQDFHVLAGRLGRATARLDELRTGLQQELAQAEGWQRELLALEQTLGALDEAVREQAALLADANQRIIAESTTLHHEAEQSEKIQADLERVQGELAKLSLLVASLSSDAARAGREARAVEADAAEGRAGVDALEVVLAATNARLEELHRQLKENQEGQFDLMRQTVVLQNAVNSHKKDLDKSYHERERERAKRDNHADTLASVERGLEQLAVAEADLQERLARAKQVLADKVQEGIHLQRLREDTVRLQANLREQRSGLLSRIEILERLERSHEGLDTGVREVFALLEQPNPGPWRTILGIVADFLTVRREYAPLIDLALGARASHFLVRDPVLLRAALEQRGQPFAGRVSFYPLPPPHDRRSDGLSGSARSTDGGALHPAERSPLVRLPGPVSPEGRPTHPGVVAAAEQLVRCDRTQLADLPRRLLARTLVVRDLAAARAIAAHTSGYRFVTLQGELLEADGTLTVGTHHAETGILSRRSELRELREQVTQLDERLIEIERTLEDLKRRSAQADAEADEVRQQLGVLSRQEAELRAAMAQHHQQRDSLQQNIELSRSEMDAREHDIATLEATLERARADAAEAEERVRSLHEQIAEGQHESSEKSEQRDRQQKESTAAKVALAQVEERRQSLRARALGLEADRSRRQQELEQVEGRVCDLQDRLRESTAKRLSASSSLAYGYLHKESAERALARLTPEREEKRFQRQQLADLAQGWQETWRARQKEIHAHEMEVNDLRHSRDALVERLREDYQVGLRLSVEGDRSEAFGPDETVLPFAPIGENCKPEAEEEIAELKRKLTRLGSVNLDALQELHDLELRSATLQAQYDDLAAAQRSLNEIISRINVDSRRLFAETLETVKAHFQELFRKLFGGGQADIVLEDEVDILESGIEIIARPPGKELRSISLMSGGEKTLTAVALLLAIFRSKPSPFCILDEVDAALDEANVGRLASVLREFLDRSQFILITHSKRTMATADVLYGVTMQESGISKRVAVRFEDWPDDERNSQDQSEQEVA
jgi:chromosome segregation protein